MMVGNITIPRKLQKDINRAVRILKDGGCSEVFLFGSGVTGKFRENSDIDLAIRGCPRSSFFNLLGRLIMELDRQVDLVNLDIQNPFTNYLQKEGTLVRIG